MGAVKNHFHDEICGREIEAREPEPASRVREEMRLRRITEILVASAHFAPSEGDRMRRIQNAYDLAYEIDGAVAYTRDNGPYE